MALHGVSSISSFVESIERTDYNHDQARTSGTLYNWVYIVFTESSYARLLECKLALCTIIKLINYLWYSSTPVHILYGLPWKQLWWCLMFPACAENPIIVMYQLARIKRAITKPLIYHLSPPPTTMKWSTSKNGNDANVVSVYWTFAKIRHSTKNFKPKQKQKQSRPNLYSTSAWICQNLPKLGRSIARLITIWFFRGNNAPAPVYTYCACFSRLGIQNTNNQPIKERERKMKKKGALTVQSSVDPRYLNEI